MSSKLEVSNFSLHLLDFDGDRTGEVNTFLSWKTFGEDWDNILSNFMFSFLLGQVTGIIEFWAGGNICLFGVWGFCFCLFVLCYPNVLF